MKINKPFNTLSYRAYFHYIGNHKKYTDFNTLGLYRSLLENAKLTTQQKIEIRDYANKFFGKFFNFLVLKDWNTYVRVSSLGEDFSHSQATIFENNADKVRNHLMKTKSLGLRHNCGIEGCPYNGVMIPGSYKKEHFGAPTKVNRYSRLEAKKQAAVLFIEDTD